MAANSTSDVPGTRLVNEGKAWLGVPYLFGGNSSRGIDCSALMDQIATALGFTIPRTSQEQYSTLIPIDASQVLPGDLVFSAGSDGTTSRPGHVGMYAGGGQVLNAPHTGTVVRLESLSGFGAVGYRRIPGVNGSPADAKAAGGAGVTSSGGSSSSSSGGILDWPADITGFFKTATDDLTSTASWFSAFAKVTTWMRIGAGIVGFPLLIVGLVLLVKAARTTGVEAPA